MQKIYISENEYKKTDKHPSHRIKLIPEEGAEDEEWLEVGALWLTKSGDSWSGHFAEYVTLHIDTEKLAEFKANRKGRKTQGTSENLNPEEIPF